MGSGNSSAVGGQALIEGVMMRRGNQICSAVIKDDKIKVKKVKFNSLMEKNIFFRLPIIRGIVVLFEMGYLGMKEMIWSANESEEKEEEKIGKTEIFLSIAFAFIFAILLFKLLPLGITRVMQNLDIIKNRVVFNLVDGLIRIFIFILYIYLISLMKDVRRVFQYHGAEHKAVNCYEKGLKLTVKNARQFTTLHSRCGTSFIFIVLIAAIIIFSLVPIDLSFVSLFFFRLPLVFPIAGVSYEILKISSKYEHNPLFKLFIMPGLLIQKITTKEPDDSQLEVAISALKPLVSSKSL